MRLPRILPILATSLLLVSCGSDTDDGGAPGSAPEGAKAADTRSGATPDADDGDRAVSEDPADFSDLTEAESFMFTANSGTRAGTSFTTPNGNIACHIVVERAACVVMEHGGWPTEDRAQDGLSEYEPDTIGWRTQVGEYAPVTWLTQGEWPIRDGITLDNNSYLDVPLNFDGDAPRISCANRDDTVTCVSGGHGFTVGTDAYETW